jgi:ABC-2 type transport system permease protein
MDRGRQVEEGTPAQLREKASSALYPLAILPGWLRALALINPLTYEVQGLRQMLVGVGGSGLLWLDFLVVASFFVAMVLAATRAYPTAIL